MKKCKIILIVFIMFTLSIIKTDKVFADGVNTNDFHIVQCEYTPEYIAWTKLSDEEKENTIMPSMCDLSNSQNNISVSAISSQVKSIFDAKVTVLSSKYDPRKSSYMPDVKDQYPTGGCWAFSTITSFEMYLGKLLNINERFSTRHMEYALTRNFLDNKTNEYGYNRVLGSGGNMYMTSNYLINGLGPIKEEEMPFEPNEDMIDIIELEGKTVSYDVNNVMLETNRIGSVCSGNEITNIKNYVQKYGAVMITTYMLSMNNNPYYNDDTYAYYYNGKSAINHMVTIVGWDDDFSKDKFNSSNKPSKDGAWIVQNSYGTSWGDGGYYYLSYEDVHVCDIYMAITDIDQEVEDNSYSYDKLGYNAFYGYGNDTYSSTSAYAMNVFKKYRNKSELLKEVTFGTTGTGNYKLYYYEGNGGTVTIEDMIYVGSGKMTEAGYITHKFEEPILLADDVTNFSIAVFYDMDTSTLPIAVSEQDNSKYTFVTLDYNKSFMSYNGYYWEDLAKNNRTSIASIKAFTDDVDYSLDLISTSISSSGNKFFVDIEYLSRNLNSDKLSVLLKDNKEKDVSITSTIDDTEISFSINNTIPYGEYSIYVYYEGNCLARKDILIGQKITSSSYYIDQSNLIIYTNPNVSIKNFASKLNGIINTTGLSSTNMTYTGMNIDNYTVVVFGDVTGDGNVNIADVVKIADHTIQQNVLDNVYILQAADVTNDGNINIADVVKVADHTLDKSIILWESGK